MLMFLEEAPAVIPLLTAAANHPATPERIRQYASRLLDAYGSQKGATGHISPLFPEVQFDVRAAVGTVPSEELIEPLSPRELEILSLIGEGCSNQEIADRLVITLHTVKKHSSNIFAKLGVNSRTQAVARANQLGLL